MQSSGFSAILSPVSERNKMNNEMRVEGMYGLENHAPKRTFKCWNCDETHPIEIKKDWGTKIDPDDSLRWDLDPLKDSTRLDN